MRIPNLNIVRIYFFNEKEPVKTLILVCFDAADNCDEYIPYCLTEGLSTSIEFICAKTCGFCSISDLRN